MNPYKDCVTKDPAAGDHRVRLSSLLIYFSSAGPKILRLGSTKLKKRGFLHSSFRDSVGKTHTHPPKKRTWHHGTIRCNSLQHVLRRIQQTGGPSAERASHVSHISAFREVNIRCKQSSRGGRFSRRRCIYRRLQRMLLLDSNRHVPLRRPPFFFLRGGCRCAIIIQKKIGLRSPRFFFGKGEGEAPTTKGLTKVFV